ncbi:hypothetical protein [Yersinia wautersii]|uniref:hypothetical protein n=1 Tax=Yersinia wautersii TaxID=1341643 RepID=UPI0005B4E3BE|nr:hypothetical protein [Yersinia wautersii]
MALSKKKLFIMVMLGAVFLMKAPGYILSPTVDAIYQSEDYDVNLRETCKYTVILISKPPFTKSGMRKLWLNNKEVITNKWHPLIKECDRIYFVKNSLERVHDSTELKYWVGDYQICLRGKFIDKCISNENIFLDVSFQDTFNKNKFTDKYDSKSIYVTYRGI